MTQALHFFHSTVIPETKIQSFLGSRKLSSSQCEIMLGLHGTIQKFTIFSEKDSIIPKNTFKYYTGTSIIWGTFNDNYLWTLNSDNVMTISDFKDQFKKIASIQLEKRQEPYNLFETTQDLKCVLIASKGSDFCYILSLNKDEIEVNIKILHEMKIIDIAAGSNQNSFQLLTLQNDKQDVVTLNLKNLEIAPKNIENTATKLISVKNSKQANVMALLYPDKLENPAKKSPLILESPIIAYSNVLKTRIIIQDDQNHVRGIDLQSLTMDTDILAPRFTQIFLLPNNLAFGVCDNGDNLIFMVSPNSKDIDMSQNASLDLESPLSIKSASFFNGRLFAADSRGVFSYRYSEFPPEEVIPYKSKPPFRLFTDSTDAYALTSSEGTEIVGKEDVIPEGKGSLLGLYQISDEMSVCVYTGGLYITAEKDDEIPLKDATACDYLNEKLLIAHSQCKLSIYECENFKEINTTIIDIADDTEITAVAISENFIASSHYYMNACIGRIILMSSDFSEKDSIDVPSRVTSMIFVDEGKKLFAGMMNGTVLSLEASEDGYLVKSCYVYIGHPSIDLYFVRRPNNENEFFFVDERLYHYYDKTFHEEPFMPMDAFCLYKDEIGVFFLSTAKDGNITARNFWTESQSTHTFDLPIEIKNTFYITQVGSFGFAMSIESQEQFTLHVFDLENCKVLTQKSFEGSASILVAHKSKDKIKILAADCGKSQTIFGIIFDGENLTLQFTQKLEDIVTAVCSIGHKIVIATRKLIRIAKFIDDKLLFSYAKTELINDVNMLVTHERYIWCSVENYGVAVLSYNKRDDRFEGVGQFRNLSDKITAIAPVDDLTVCFSTTNGDIYFIAIDINIVLGLKTFCMESLPSLNMIGRVNVGRDVIAIFRKDQNIYYLIKDGTMGALHPAPLLTEFRRAERYQFSALQKYSQAVGFFHAGHSLSAQKGVVDIDFIECLNQQNIISDSENISEVMAAISHANINIVLK